MALALALALALTLTLALALSRWFAPFEFEHEVESLDDVLSLGLV